MIREFKLGRTIACGHFIDDRFTKLFVEVWDSLPPVDCGLLNDYWNNLDNHHQLQSPIIAFCPQQINNVGAASTDLRGFLLRFHKQAIQNSPDEDVKDVIAHELGHVYEYADPNFAEPVAVREQFANGTMDRWGYTILVRARRPDYVPKSLWKKYGIK